MRAILSKSVRPRIGRPQVALTGSRTPLQTKGVPLVRRKLTLCDVFTILLAPVLTTAFVADVTHKDRRRRNWDLKIAQIQQEIDELRDRECGLWDSLQMRPISVLASDQRRHYSTTAATKEWRYVNSRAQCEVDTNITEAAPSMVTQETGNEVLTDLRQFESLLAIKVGLQFLLHISTGRDPTAKLNLDQLSHSTVLPDSMDELLRQLARINKGLYDLKPKLTKWQADFSVDANERRRLDTKITQLAWRCRTGNITIPELVYGYTETVMKFQIGPSLDTYQTLVETFSTLDADALTFIAMIPYTRTRQVHSDRNISNIIQSYGKVKDPRRLEKFLQRIVQSERGFAVTTNWETVVVDGVSVSVPVTRHPRILDALVRAALQGDQPHKARAWATILFQNSVSVSRLAATFNNFLTYCARQVDWPNGQLWLDRTVAWAALFARDAPWFLPRIVFRMLDLCMSCEQHGQYDMILSAAVTAGLDLPPLDETRPDAFSDQAKAIRNDWKTRMNEQELRYLKLNISFDTATTFQREVARAHTAINNFIGETDMEKLKALLDTKETPATGDEAYRRLGSALNEHGFQTSHKAAHTLTQEARMHAMGQPKEGEPLSDSEKRFSLLQGSYNRLSDNYRQQCEVVKLLQKLVDDKPLAPDMASDSGYIQERIQGLSRSQEQTQYGNDLSIDLHRQIDVLQAQNSEMASTLETSTDREQQLVRTIDDLRSQLKSIKPKSLEAVFVEKENLNMRLELRALSGRHLALLDQKEDMQKEMAALQLRRDRLDERRSADLHLVNQENKNLRLQVEAAEKQHQKLFQASKAREGNLQKVLLIKEERITALRAEISKLKASDETPPSTTAENTQPFGEEVREHHQSDSVGQKFTLRSNRSTESHALGINYVNSFSFPSS